MKSLKCVILGDTAVGKSCLLVRYGNHKFSKAPIPTVFNSHTLSTPVGSDIYDMHFYDTSGYDDYDQIPILRDTNIILICFAVDSWQSFVNVQEKWMPELREYCAGILFIVVGTKIDLRNDQKTIKKLALKSEKPISTIQGEELAKKLHAFKYMECSALKNKNVDKLFEEAINAVLSSTTSSGEVYSTPAYGISKHIKSCSIS